MQLKQALHSAIEKLTAEHVPSPRMNAELLIMFTLDCNRAYLYAHPERELTVEEISQYDDAIARRATGVPAQYITGHQEFWGMDLIVSPAVLIPRPETEHVVESVLELAREHAGPGERLNHKGHAGTRSETLDHGGHGGTRGKPRDGAEVRMLRIVDVGTGSGAITLALAKELPSAEIHATDISAEALEVAQANAARHEMSSRIAFHQTDLLTCFLSNPSDEGVQSSSRASYGLRTSNFERVAPAAAPRAAGVPAAQVKFDFVVSNPPYVGESEEDQVQLEVRKFEPRNAVFAGPTGLEVIERLVPQAHEVLQPGGWLVLEINGTIADGVRQLLSSWDQVAITNDLQGISRVARAQKPVAANPLGSL